ncbi:MAG: hypothetical protein JW894_03050 [Bacteroidales bacterium]|nr:hypothetical protein [Bacteroidales bacterium]
MVLALDSFETNAYYTVDEEYDYLYASNVGDLEVTEDALNMKVNQVIMDTAFFNGYIPSEEYVVFNRGTAEFYDLFGSGEASYYYEINGDVLTIWIDASNTAEYDRIE